MQKTAYGMRISDWSSYVCSSDLQFQVLAGRTAFHHRAPRLMQAPARRAPRRDGVDAVQRGVDRELPGDVGAQPPRTEQVHRVVSSEAGRVGKGWVSTGRSRWAASN